LQTNSENEFQQGKKFRVANINTVVHKNVIVKTSVSPPRKLHKHACSYTRCE